MSACTLGVPTFEIFLSDQTGGYMFCTVFSKSDHAHRCPSSACLADLAGWAKLGHRGGLSHQKTKMGLILGLKI